MKAVSKRFGRIWYGLRDNIPDRCGIVERDKGTANELLVSLEISFGFGQKACCSNAEFISL